MMAAAAALMKENGEEIVDHYSQEFAGAYLNTLKKKYKDQMVLAEDVYHQYLDNGAELPLTATMYVKF
jgi:hypothetical protein